MEADYVPGALHLAGFTQARSPHLGLLLAKDATKGTLFHIRIDRESSPKWEYQRRTQPVVGDMFLSSLLRIKEVPLPLETAGQTIEEIATELPPPESGQWRIWGMWPMGTQAGSGTTQEGDRGTGECRKAGRGNRFICEE